MLPTRARLEQFRLALTAVLAVFTVDTHGLPENGVSPQSPSHVVAVEGLEVGFSWSMPSRQQLSWQMWRAETASYAPAYLAPRAWAVHLNGCGSSGHGDPIVSFDWTLSGVDDRRYRRYRRERKATPCAVRFEDLPQPGRCEASLMYDAGRDLTTLKLRNGIDAGLRASVELRGYNEALRLDPLARRAYLRSPKGWIALDLTKSGAVRPVLDGAFVLDVEPSPDGQRLALAYRWRAQRVYEVEILDAATRASQLRWVEAERPRRLKWSADGRRIAVQWQNRHLHVRDAHDGTSLARFDGNASASETTRFDDFGLSADGRRVAQLGRSGTVRVRGAAPADERHMGAGANALVATGFGFDGDTVITANFYGALQFWPLGPGAAARELPAQGAIEGFSSKVGSQAGRRAAQIELHVVGPSTIVRVRGEDRRVLGAFSTAGEVTAAVATGRDARRVVLLVAVQQQRNGMRMRMERWHVDPAARELASEPFIVWRDADRAALWLSDDRAHVVTREDGGFVFRSVDRLQAVKTIRHAGPDWIAWHAGGRHLAATGEDGRLRVWLEEAALFSEVARMAPPVPPQQIHFSDDARWITTQAEQGPRLLWALHPEALTAIACARLQRGC